MHQIYQNETQLAKLTEYLPELEKAEQQLQEAIDFVNYLGKKWENRLAKKQANKVNKSFKNSDSVSIAARTIAILVGVLAQSSSFTNQLTQ